MFRIFEAREILELLKAKAAAQGEVRTWADGYERRKVGKKWVVVATAPKEEEKTIDEAEKHFDYALASNLGAEIESVLGNSNIDSFESLTEAIKTGPANTAHKIYKKIVDTIHDATGTQEDKQVAMHLVGVSLVKLHDQYAPEKVNLKIKKTSKKGKKYYAYDNSPEKLPTLKASEISKAKKKMAGWSITGELSTQHVRGMLKTGAAKLTSGKIDGKRKWVMPKKSKDMTLSYKGDTLGIEVKQVKKVGTQMRATAKVEIKVPYAYAKAFLQSHIKSTETRNNFVFRMEHSQGYRNFIERASA